MDWNDVVKNVGQFAFSHRGELGKGLAMVWEKLHGASGDEPLVTPNGHEPLVTPSGHVLTASEAILISMYGHATNVLAKQLGAEGTEEINSSHEMTSWAVEAGKLQQLWFGDSE